MRILVIDNPVFLAHPHHLHTISPGRSPFHKRAALAAASVPPFAEAVSFYECLLFADVRSMFASGLADTLFLVPPYHL